MLSRAGKREEHPNTLFGAAYISSTGVCSSGEGYNDLSAHVTIGHESMKSEASNGEVVHVTISGWSFMNKEPYIMMNHKPLPKNEEEKLQCLERAYAALQNFQRFVEANEQRVARLVGEDSRVGASEILS